MQRQSRIIESNGQRFVLPLGHEFVDGRLKSLDEEAGCAFIIEGGQWTISDPIRCRKPAKEHAPITLTRKDDMFYWIRRAIFPTPLERFLDWWRR